MTERPSGQGSAGDGGEAGPHEGEPVGERVEVWRQTDGAWRWQYVGPGPEPVVIPSAAPTRSRQEAVDAACLAYAGLPLVGQEPDDASPSPRGRRWWFVTVVVCVLVVAVRGLVRRART